MGTKQRGLALAPTAVQYMEESFERGGFSKEDGWFLRIL